MITQEGGSPSVSPTEWSRLGTPQPYHFKEAVKGSKWAVVRGWHMLRHSFASNLARAGVDQRKIDRWMGHSTDVRWRYQHLRPEDQRDDIGAL